MCCHIRSASVSRRRQIKVASGSDAAAARDARSEQAGGTAGARVSAACDESEGQMWTLLDVRRHGDVLLCVVRWVCPAKKTKPYALVEVSLTEAAVRWRDFASFENPAMEIARRCIAPAPRTGAT
jgi:hypothetical protein